MIELFLAQAGGGGLPTIPSWEYLGGLSVALFFAYLFVAGKIISGKDADERVSEWKELAKEATKDNAESTQELVNTTKEVNQTLASLVKRTDDLVVEVKNSEYETKQKRDELSREIQKLRDEVRR